MGIDTGIGMGMGADGEHSRSCRQATKKRIDEDFIGRGSGRGRGRGNLLLRMILPVRAIGQQDITFDTKHAWKRKWKWRLMARTRSGERHREGGG